MVSPSGDMRTTPASLAFLVADPSVWIVHVLLGDSTSSWALVNSTMKFVRTWALIATRSCILCQIDLIQRPTEQGALLRLSCSSSSLLADQS